MYPHESQAATQMHVPERNHQRAGSEQRRDLPYKANVQPQRRISDFFLEAKYKEQRCQDETQRVTRAKSTGAACVRLVAASLILAEYRSDSWAKESVMAGGIVPPPPARLQEGSLS